MGHFQAKVKLACKYEHESVAIMKIKESMQEEAKQFEKTGAPNDRPTDFFIPQ